MEMGMGDVEEEADDIYNGILGEIGLEYSVDDPVRICFLMFLESSKRRSKGLATRGNEVGRRNG